MNIVLIGYRGAGKSSVGRRVAGRLRKGFVDTDELVESREGRSIKEIVDSAGWARFRKLEKAVIAETALRDGLVIAPGGGAVADGENVARLKANGRILWLKAGCETLAERLSRNIRAHGRRPSLTGRDIVEELRDVLAEREPLYERAADDEIDTTALSEDEVVEKIMEIVNVRGRRT